MTGFCPKGRRERGLKKESAEHIIGCIDSALSLAVLLGGIGTREPKKNTVVATEGV